MKRTRTSIALPLLLACASISTAVGLTVVVLRLSEESSQLLVLAMGMLVGGLVVLAYPRSAVYLSVGSFIFIGLVRRLLGGDASYVENDPLIAVPPMILLLFVAARPWGRRYVSRLAPLLGVLALYTVAIFLLVAPWSDQLIALVRGAVVFLAALLVGIALTFENYRRYAWDFVRATKWFSLAAAIYGVLQFALSPSWDLSWLRTVNTVVNSFGRAEPGEFRLFGPMTSPLAFATVLAVGVLVWAFDRESRIIVRALAIATLFVPLLLTSVRTAIFGLAVAGIVLALVTGGRRATTILLGVIAGAALIPLVIGIFAPQLTDRFALDDLGSDTSFNARVELLAERTLGAVFSIGLGPGGSNRGATVVDNGFVAAFLDLGLVGGLLFLGAVVAVVVVSIRAVRIFKSSQQAMFLAIAIFFLFSELSAPVIQTQLGLMFWVSGASAAVAIATTRTSPFRTRQPRPRVLQEVPRAVVAEH